MAHTCPCIISQENVSDFPELKAVLPPGYSYNVCKWNKLNETQFDSTFRVNVSTAEAALSWIEEFKATSNSAFNKDRTFPQDAVRNLYKVYLKCVHNTKPKCTVKKPHEKHTKCPARLLITVKKTEFSSKSYQSCDIHLPEFPMNVTYRNTHNHVLDSAEAIKYHPLKGEVKKIFQEYFEEGLTPGKAFDKYKSILKESHGDEYYTVVADGSLFPDKKALYKMYDAAFKREYGEASGKQMLFALESFVEKYNFDMDGRFAELKVFDDENFVVVVVTPMMKRVLENLSETSEVLFSDSTGNVDSYGVKIYLFLTNSCCGGLPICSIITTSEREDILTSAFDLFRSFLTGAFGGEGLNGPKIIMTDDSSSERNSFRTVFPDAKLLLCIFHVLQAAWRFIMAGRNGIPNEKKQDFFFQI